MSAPFLCDSADVSEKASFFDIVSLFPFLFLFSFFFLFFNIFIHFYLFLLQRVDSSTCPQPKVQWSSFKPPSLFLFSFIFVILVFFFTFFLFFFRFSCEFMHPLFIFRPHALLLSLYMLYTAMPYFLIHGVLHVTLKSSPSRNCYRFFD